MSESLEALYRLATRNNGNRRSDEEVDKDFKIVEKALKDYESIDNANPSEALECLDGIEYVADVLKVNHKIGSRDIANQEIKEMAERLYYRIPTIKQALLKAQFLEEEYNNLMEDKDNLESELFKQSEPKHYLKWEDLEFGVNKHKIKVKLNDSLYVVECFVDGYRFKTVNFYAYVYKGNLQPMFYLQEEKKQFFNDLHLEEAEDEVIRTTID